MAFVLSAPVTTRQGVARRKGAASAGTPAQSGPPNVARIPNQRHAGHGGPQQPRRKRAALPLVSGFHM